MEFIDFLFGSEKREGTPADDDDFWYGPVGGVSANGMYINHDTALSISAVYSCVRVIAEGIAALPLPLYKRLPDGGKEREKDHPLSILLSFAPNKWQTKFEFWEMMTGHVCLRGNAYARKIKGSNGYTIALIPLDPDRMKIGQKADSTLIYEYRNLQGETLLYSQNDILHLRGLSTDGFSGLSPLALHQRVFSNAIMSDQYSISFLQNAAQPSGALKHPKFLSDPARENLKKGIRQAHSGPNNAGNILILEEGMEWVKLGVTQRDAQFLESRKFTNNDIARIFRVPPHMIGDLERATFSNIEQQSIDFVVNTLTPWLVRYEQAMWRDLIPDEEKETHFAEFLVAGLLRGDMQARYNAYVQGLNNGFLNADEVRSFENLNPIPDGSGQTYRVPLNTVASDEEPKPEEDPKNEPKKPQEPTEDDDNYRTIDAFKPIFQAEYGRFLRRKTNRQEGSHKKYLREAFTPLFEGMLQLKRSIKPSELLSETRKQVELFIAADEEVLKRVDLYEVDPAAAEAEKNHSFRQSKVWDIIKSNL